MYNTNDITKIRETRCLKIHETLGDDIVTLFAKLT